ncbi:hypothetical protein ACE6H2_027612 [Prunus campanulata]
MSEDVASGILSGVVKRLFFGFGVPPLLQTLPFRKDITNNAVPQCCPNNPNLALDMLTIEILGWFSSGMKVYITDEKEPFIKWAGNPNVAVKAFGLKATAQPYVDFGLKLIGADLMSIPGLYRFVQELIKDQVANMYLWPKTLELPIMDPAKAFNRPVGILHVKVLRAMKLKKKDLLGALDPYVKLKLPENNLPSHKTSVKHKNLNPEWNEEFNIVVKDPQSQALEFLFMTGGSFDLNDAQDEKQRGQLEVELTYKPFEVEDMQNGFEETLTVQKAPEGTPPGGGLLVVVVHKAQDLEGKHHCNPSVRLVFRGEEKRTKV